MDQKKIGKFIAECRKNKKMTQDELAEKIGVTNRTISNWENGKYLPDYNVLLPLCKELNITIVELLDGEKQKTEEKENKYLQQAEKIIDFVSFNYKVNIQQCRKIGKILFIGGILLCLFSMFFLPRGILEGSWLFVPIGGLFILLGFSYMNKKYNYKKRITLNFISLIIFIVSISLCDLINVTFLNNEPKFSTCSYQGYQEYCRTILFDTYRCRNQDNKYHVVYKGYVDMIGDTVATFDFCD